MRVRSLARLALLAAAAGTIACGGATTPDRAGPAAFLNLSAGNNQTATVATLLPDPLKVTVTDAQSRPVPGVSVAWAVTAGNGAVNPLSTPTDASGTAQATFTVGPTAGTNEVTATVAGVSGSTKFTFIGTAGPLAQVLAASHNLVLSCGVDSGHVSANTTDQYGNPVSGTVTWVSRNPSIATVDASGAVKLVSTTGNTYIVGTAPGAKADSVLVAGGVPLTMAAGAVNQDLGSSSLCVKSNQAGSEYALVAFYNQTSPGLSTSITVSASGLGTVGSGANLAPAQIAALTQNLPPVATIPSNEKFEYALRERERAEMPKYVAGARAAYARAQQQRLSANIATGASSATALAERVPASVQVGDFVQLNTNANAYCTNPTMTTARVAAISSSAIIVSDTSNPSGGFTDAEYQNFAVGMDTLVMPVDTTTFGTPSDIDGNHKVVILFTKAVNQLTTDPSQGVVLGFYYSRDLLPPNPTGGSPCPGSNHAEMFYLLVPDVNRTINGGNNYTKSKANVANVVLGTIGHEFQHLINASRRMYVINSPVTDEETWLNEGLSHIAEELVFYRASGLGPGQNLGLATLSNPNVYSAFGLYMYGNQGRYQTFLPVTESHGPIGEFSGDDDLPTRAATWTFLRYLADHRPTDNTFFYRLVNSQTSGLANIQSVIGTDPAPAMRDWATSVYANGTVTGIDSTYNQPSWNWPQVFALTQSSYRHPLSHTLTNDSTVTVTLKTDGTAFFPFAVSNGQQGLLTVAGPGGTALPAGVQLMLIRTK